jgi:hypothetical protein
MGKKMLQRASSMAIKPDNNLSKPTEKPTTGVLEWSLIRGLELLTESP